MLCGRSCRETDGSVFFYKQYIYLKCKVKFLTKEKATLYNRIAFRLLLISFWMSILTTSEHSEILIKEVVSMAKLIIKAIEIASAAITYGGFCWRLADRIVKFVKNHFHD